VLTIELGLPPGTDLSAVETLVEATCRSRGLALKIKRPLKGLPSSTHWHFKKARHPGTLEITFDKKGMRLLLSVHENRRGPWTTPEMNELKASLESLFE
jgi:hypothetical protein